MSRFKPTYGGGVDPALDLTKNLAKLRPGLMFAGALTKTAGSAGDSTHYCTFVYTVTDLHGIVVGKALAPERGRLVKCTMVEATAGVFYFDPRRAVHLWDTNETATQTNC